MKSRRPRERTETSLAAIFTGPGQLELRELAVPAVRAGEALVRVTCCTICGSDLHTFTGARREVIPSILGHELIGTVHSVGDPPPSDVTGNAIRPNDRVTWSTAIACGACDRCEMGMPQKCQKLAKYGHECASGRTALSGGLADFVLLRPGTTVVMLGAEIPDHVACPANCATATVAAAFRAADRVRGQRVLIFGAGMLGLTAVAYAKGHGAARIVVCDRIAARLDRALTFGADDVVVWPEKHDDLRRQQATEFDIVLEFSGDPATLELGCQLADVAARVILVGTVTPCDAVRLDPEQIVRRCLTIRGVHNYAPKDLQTAVGFLQRFHQVFPFVELVEQHYPLNRVHEAFEFALRERPVRVAVLPSKR